MGKVSGGPIPIGATLRVVEAKHQVFYETDPGFDSVQWLFEVVDGAQAGEIYDVVTDGSHEPGRPIFSATFNVAWDAPLHPLWPEGLEPIPKGRR